MSGTVGVVSKDMEDIEGTEGEGGKEDASPGAEGTAVDFLHL